MARDASTYRGARRNYCIRERKMMWGPDWYYSGHNKDAHKVIPWDGRAKRKAPTTTSGVHELLKRGDYAGAVRRFFKRPTVLERAKASGRGD